MLDDLPKILATIGAVLAMFFLGLGMLVGCALSHLQFN